MQTVGLPPETMRRYPHAFSGGQRQRIGIARAIALKPQLIVADEATSALDVSLRAQVLDLLLDLGQELDMSYIFISHDISVIRYMCDRVAVMHRGRIVEIGDTESVCEDPQHPYTRSLISAIPKPDPRLRGTTRRIRYEPEAAAEGHRMKPSVDMRVSISRRSWANARSGARSEQALYWIDIYRADLNRFDPSTGENRAWMLPEPIGSFALCAEAARSCRAQSPASTASTSTNEALSAAGAPRSRICPTTG